MIAAPPDLGTRRPVTQRPQTLATGRTTWGERGRFWICAIAALGLHALVYFTSRDAEITDAVLVIDDSPPALQMELVAGAEPAEVAPAAPVEPPPSEPVPPEPVPPPPEPVPEPPPEPPKPEVIPEPMPEPEPEEMAPEPKPEPKPTPKPAPPRPRAAAPKPANTPRAATAAPTGAAAAGSPTGVAGGSGGSGSSDATPTYSPKPPYPIESQRAKEAGTVILRVSISAEGRPVDVSISRSSGFPRLDRAAVEGARRWRFKPAKRNGVPIEQVRNLPIQFRPPR